MKGKAVARLTKEIKACLLFSCVCVCVWSKLEHFAVKEKLCFDLLRGEHPCGASSEAQQYVVLATPFLLHMR
jgi:hypothetical protein